MPYCAAADLVERFGEEEMLRLVPDETGEALDLIGVDRACEDAAGEIDGYAAAAGYRTPLDPVPRIVVAYAADIARYRLYDVAAPEQVTKRYDDAVRFLRALGAGTVSLGPAADGARPQVDDTVHFVSGAKLFRRGVR